MKEIWKSIHQFEGLYEVSNIGRVKSLRRYGRKEEKILNLFKSPKGYMVATLYKDGVPYKYFVHVLVARAFIPNPHNKPQIDHIDNVKWNNNIINLRWVTPHENSTNELTIRLRKEGYATGRLDRTKFGQNPAKRGRCSFAHAVVCINPCTSQIKHYDCILDTVEDGFSAQCVSLCCRGKIGLHKGHKFVYVENYTIQGQTNQSECHCQPL